MKTKTSAHYQREYRKRLRDQGLVKKEVWILPENNKLLSAYEKILREPHPLSMVEFQREQSMTTQNKHWTTTSCFEALNQLDRFQYGDATIELIDGLHPSIYIQMHDFGDLPIYCTISGEQIIVETILWAESDIKDKNDFNEMILRSHKYLPLSTICLDQGADGENYYFIFGALSATSKLSNILFEIETLANNTINATEAYADYLNYPLKSLGENA